MYELLICALYSHLQINKPQKLEDALRETGETGEKGDIADAGLTGSPVSGGGHFMKSFL